jgi:hypothetical protein
MAAAQEEIGCRRFCCAGFAAKAEKVSEPIVIAMLKFMISLTIGVPQRTIAPGSEN